MRLKIRLKKKQKAEAGIALLEVLVAGAVLSISIIGLALLFSLGQTFMFAEGDERVALYLGEQRIEDLRTQGYDNIVAGTTSEAAGTIPGFPRFSRQTTVITLADPDGSGSLAAKQITVGVQSTVRAADPVTVTTILFAH